MDQQYTQLAPAQAKPRREAAFNGSKWNLYLEWRLLHCRDLTRRGSALLDAIARMLLGYRKSRGEIGRRLLMEMADIADPRDFNKVREELQALGLGVDHAGKGAGTRTTYDLGPFLAEALQASEHRRFHSRRSQAQSTTVPKPSTTTVVQPSTSTAPEPPRIETSSSSRDAYGVPSNDSFGVRGVGGLEQESPDAHPSWWTGSPATTATTATPATPIALDDIALEGTLAPPVARVEQAGPLPWSVPTEYGRLPWSVPTEEGPLPWSVSGEGQS